MHFPCQYDAQYDVLQGGENARTQLKSEFGIISCLESRSLGHGFLPLFLTRYFLLYGFAPDIPHILPTASLIIALRADP